MDDFLIYGATGFTGRLIAEHAVEPAWIPCLLAATPQVSARGVIDCTFAIAPSIWVAAEPW